MGIHNLTLESSPATGDEVPIWDASSGNTDRATLSSLANAILGYVEGTWTPSPTNLTVVGTPTYTGTYTRVGRLVTLFLKVSSTVTTAATLNSTYFSGLPFTPALGAASSSVGESVENYGSGLIFTDSKWYMPSWAAVANTYSTGQFYV